MQNSYFVWDEHSDQPHIITDKKFKEEQKKKFQSEHLKMFFLFIVLEFYLTLTLVA